MGLECHAAIGELTRCVTLTSVMQSLCHHNIQPIWQRDIVMQWKQCSPCLELNPWWHMPMASPIKLWIACWFHTWTSQWTQTIVEICVWPSSIVIVSTFRHQMGKLPWNPQVNGGCCTCVKCGAICCHTQLHPTIAQSTSECELHSMIDVGKVTLRIWSIFGEHGVPKLQSTHGLHVLLAMKPPQKQQWHKTHTTNKTHGHWKDGNAQSVKKINEQMTQRLAVLSSTAVGLWHCWNERPTLSGTTQWNKNV